MLFGKARPKLLLFGDFSLISVFCYRICALRLSQEDGCVEKNEEESLIPLISVMPFQHESSQTLPATVCTEDTQHLYTDSATSDSHPLPTAHRVSSWNAVCCLFQAGRGP